MSPTFIVTFLVASNGISFIVRIFKDILEAKLEKQSLPKGR